MLMCIVCVFVLVCGFSGLPGAYPAVVRALGRGDERRLQQGAATPVPAPGRRRLQGPPRRGVQGIYRSTYITYIGGPYNLSRFRAPISLVRAFLISFC